MGSRGSGAAHSGGKPAIPEALDSISVESRTLLHIALGPPVSGGNRLLFGLLAGRFRTGRRRDGPPASLLPCRFRRYRRQGIVFGWVLGYVRCVGSKRVLRRPTGAAFTCRRWRGGTTRRIMRETHFRRIWSSKCRRNSASSAWGSPAGISPRPPRRLSRKISPRPKSRAVTIGRAWRLKGRGPTGQPASIPRRSACPIMGARGGNQRRMFQLPIH